MKKTPNTPFRLLYNQDCTDLFVVTEEPIEPRHVDRMVDEIADAGVDVLLINPNALTTNYRSHVWETAWDVLDNPHALDSLPEKTRPIHMHWLAQAKRLSDGGCDYLARSLARCRERGIVPGISVRMNDMHGAFEPDSPFNGRFYREHPECRLSNPRHLGWSAFGFNYALQQVREYYLALIGELAERYDFEALELDFLRFVNYFPRDGAYAQHAAVMTDFVHETRRLLAQSGRKAALIPRIASTPAAAYELGFDVKTWAAERLVDGITCGLFLNTGWDMPIDGYRELLGRDIAVYASGEGRADSRDGYPARFLPSDERLLRAFGAGYLAAGADGLNFFNFFWMRERDAWNSPRFDVLRELKDLDRLRGRPKTYPITTRTSQMESDGPMQAPALVVMGQSRSFHMLMAAEPDAARLEIAFLCEGRVEQEKLWLHVNHTPAGRAAELRRDFADKPDAWTVLFSPPAHALRDGHNMLVLRNEGEPITVRGLEARVT